MLDMYKFQDVNSVVKQSVLHMYFSAMYTVDLFHVEFSKVNIIYQSC